MLSTVIHGGAELVPESTVAQSARIDTNAQEVTRIRMPMEPCMSTSVTTDRAHAGSLPRPKGGHEVHGAQDQEALSSLCRPKLDID
jgi:hypothetical protein